VARDEECKGVHIPGEDPRHHRAVSELRHELTPGPGGWSPL
jgi:hypothetical protein